MVPGPLGRDTLRHLADHDDELDLPIDRSGWELHGCDRTCDGAWKFGEDHGGVWLGQPGLSGVVRVDGPDSENLAGRGRNWRPCGVRIKGLIGCFNTARPGPKLVDESRRTAAWGSDENLLWLSRARRRQPPRAQSASADRRRWRLASDIPQISRQPHGARSLSRLVRAAIGRAIPTYTSALAL